MLQIIFLFTSILSGVNPFIMYFSLRQIFMNIWLTRSKNERAERLSDGEYAFPVKGPWLILNGGTTHETSHSWYLFGQRYAYDLVCKGRRTGLHLVWASPCYGKAVYAPASGEVVGVRDRHWDFPVCGIGMINPLASSPVGNFVCLKHSLNEYSLLAHLMHKSVKVKVGDIVQAGDQIGAVGNSGHSTEPHLHFQIQDRKEFLASYSKKIRFTPKFGAKPIFLERGDQISD